MRLFVMLTKNGYLYNKRETESKEWEQQTDR